MKWVIFAFGCLFSIFMMIGCGFRHQDPSFTKEIKILDDCLNTSMLYQMQKQEIIEMLYTCLKQEDSFVQNISLNEGADIWFKVNEYKTDLDTEIVREYIVFDFDGIYEEKDFDGDRQFYFTAPNWSLENWYSISMIEHSL